MLGGLRNSLAALTPGKDPAQVVQKVGWTPKARLDGCGKSRIPPELDP